MPAGMTEMTLREMFKKCICCCCGARNKERRKDLREHADVLVCSSCRDETSVVMVVPEVGPLDGKSRGPVDEKKGPKLLRTTHNTQRTNDRTRRQSQTRVRSKQTTKKLLLPLHGEGIVAQSVMRGVRMSR
jgi:hypothetical protein